MTKSRSGLYSPRSQGKTPAARGYTVKSSNFVDRDLCKVSPLKEQFEPTDAQPVRQHFKMAGGC